MQLARFLNNVFKKDGFILIDANSKSYIIGNPKSENPLKLKILNKNLLPPLSILNTKDESDLINNLEKLNFSIKNTKAA